MSTDLKKMPCPHCGEFVRPKRHCDGAGCGWITCPDCAAVVEVSSGGHICPTTNRTSCKADQR